MASFSSISLISCCAAPCMRLMSHPGTSMRGSPPCIAFRIMVSRSSRDSMLSILSRICISGGSRDDTSFSTCCCILFRRPAKHARPTFACQEAAAMTKFPAFAAVQMPCKACKSRICKVGGSRKDTSFSFCSRVLFSHPVKHTRQYHALI